MIVDTSAVIAVAFAEPDAREIVDLIENSGVCRISAASLFEAFALVDRRGNAEATRLVETIVQRVGMVVEPVTVKHVELARIAWRGYGKGSGHAASLNFGDCFAYALAKERDEPLLFVGHDFAHTDLKSVLRET